MQKHLTIGRGIKILDRKNREGDSTNPPASLRVKEWVEPPLQREGREKGNRWRGINVK